MPTGLGRRFGNLRIRPKLILLHNIFFLTLTAAIYFTLIPSFERRVLAARANEIRLLTEILADTRGPMQSPKLGEYQYQQGSAEALRISPDTRKWLDAHSGEVAMKGDFLYKALPVASSYVRLTLPVASYEQEIHTARNSLFGVLAVVYIFAVGVLELLIMPTYVYGPIGLMLTADEATREGNRENELIAEAYITDDEIGQIMRSRNDTVRELRRHEDELAEALAHVEAQDRLASLGLLSASVAHEMNTPLAVLHGSVEKLLETTAEPVAGERLRRMLRVTDRLRRISEGLVDFSRVRHEEFGRVPLRALIEEAWHLVSIDDKASQVKFTTLIGEEAAIIGNADRLIQVFVNLLRNSLQNVGEHGTIEVRCRRTVRDGKSWITTTLEDNGPGIPGDVLPNIFDAFVSSRLDSRGTGLGLTVAAGIIEQHEGQIHAANRPGGGARLEVTLRESVMREQTV